MSSVSEQILSLLFYGLLVCIAAGANCGIENVSLLGKTAARSDGVDASDAVDNDVKTSVTISSPNTLNIELSTPTSDNWFIKSVQITPARPTHKTGTTTGSDKKDTSKCIFPFKKGGVLQYKCVDSGFGFEQCSYKEHVEYNEWSSCNSGQPDGSLSDNIEVKLSSDQPIASCGTTGSGFNSNRSVSCTNPMVNAKSLVLKKTSGSLQVANINVTRYTLENSMTTSGTWREGSIDATLSVSGCTPDFTISKIVWKYRPYSNVNTTLGTTDGNVKSFTIPNITRQHSGFYYFEYKNSNGQVFFKSNEVKKQVSFKSILLRPPFKKEYSGCEGDTVPVICAAGLSYPPPKITVKIASDTLSCINYSTREFDAESQRCETNLSIKSEYNNLKLICINQQTGENLTATVTVLPCISTTTSFTQNTAVPNLLSPGGIAGIAIACIVVVATIVTHYHLLLL